MTPEQFIQTWHKNTLNEEAGAQGHCEDLCSLLGIPKPRDKGQYCFERKGALSEGRTGYADVWKDRHFGWENKAPGENLNKALDQLKRYASALQNPPLLAVCDRERIEIHTNFQNYPTEVHRIGLLDIGIPENLQKHAEARPGKRKALSTVSRYIVTAAVAKHRTFVWMNATVLPDQATLAITREDETTLGFVHSRFHELWGGPAPFDYDDAERVIAGFFADRILRLPTHEQATLCMGLTGVDDLPENALDKSSQNFELDGLRIEQILNVLLEALMSFVDSGRAPEDYESSEA